MPKYTGTIVEHIYRTFEYEGDDFDLAKDHLDTLISHDAYGDWEITYSLVEVVGINQQGV